MKELLIRATALPSLFSLTTYLPPIKSLLREREKGRKEKAKRGTVFPGQIPVTLAAC